MYVLICKKNRKAELYHNILERNVAAAVITDRGRAIRGFESKRMIEQLGSLQPSRKAVTTRWSPACQLRKDDLGKRIIRAVSQGDCNQESRLEFGSTSEAGLSWRRIILTAVHEMRGLQPENKTWRAGWSGRRIIWQQHTKRVDYRGSSGMNFIILELVEVFFLVYLVI